MKNTALKKMLILLTGFALLSWSGQQLIEGKVEEKLPFSGTYEWSFEIPNQGMQTLTYSFYPYAIQTKMEGRAFSTEYTQVLVSYDPLDNRVITIGRGGTESKDNVYQVMFFKDITDSTMTIYKHDSKSGLKEAQDFAYPDPDTDKDHGWITYKKAASCY